MSIFVLIFFDHHQPLKFGHKRLQLAGITQSFDSPCATVLRKGAITIDGAWVGCVPLLFQS